MKRRPPRWLWVTGASVLLVAAVGLAPRYVDWKTQRLQHSAEQALANGQALEASLDAAAALQIRPGDPELTQLLIDAYEATDNERLLDVLSQQLHQHPESPTARFQLARAAMRFGRLGLSAQALAEMPAAATDSVDYHEISSALATLSKRGADLLVHARQLHRLEPDNSEHLLKIAGLAVLAGHFALEDAEFASLRHLRDRASKSADAIEAAVLLWALSMLDDYRFADHPELQLSLLPTLADPAASFAQCFKALDLASALGQAEVADAIFQLLEEGATASGDREEIGVLLAWTNSKGVPSRGLAWARELGLLSGDKPAGALAAVLADLCARTASWGELEWIVTGTDWGSGEFLRHFYAAKCAGERPSPATDLERESFLRLALKDSSSSPAHLQLLWNAARRYAWQDLAQSLSWAIAERSSTLPERRAILQAIAAEALGTGDLESFRRASSALLMTSPAQWELRNNDYYARLLATGCTPQLLAEIARFREELPTHSDVDTTYALALHLAGRSSDAAAVLRAIPTSARRSPSVAPFCAFIFAAAGEPALAKEYAALPHQLFFPEERALLAASE